MVRRKRYEYQIEEFSMMTPDEMESKLNQMAESGWQLRERIDVGGTAWHFIFERPVE